MLRASCGDYGSTESFGNLYRRKTHSTGCCVNEDPISSFDVCSRNQRSVGRGHRNEKACGLEEGPALGYGLELLFFGTDELGIASLSCTEDLVADGEFVATLGGDGCDYAAEFGARDPRERRLVLVFAADLEEVEEVGCCAVDTDGVLVRVRDRVRNSGYLQILRALRDG